MVTIGKDMTIIVVNFIVNNDKLLLVQESKVSCYGKWYLPAGRLERNETLMEGAKRECIEESGIEVEYDGIYSVEFPSRSWIRITFLGHYLKGALKNVKDKESIKAEWVPLEIVINGGDDNYKLRARDISKIASHWFKLNKPQQTHIFPIEIEHSDVILEVIIQKHFNDQLYTLIDPRIGTFPRMKTNTSFMNSITKFLKKNLILDDNSPILSWPWINMLKLSSLEFGGSKKEYESKTDGILIRVLLPIIKLNSPRSLLNPQSKYQWKQMLDSSITFDYEQLPHAPFLIDSF